MGFSTFTRSKEGANSGFSNYSRSTDFKTKFSFYSAEGQAGVNSFRKRMTGGAVTDKQSNENKSNSDNLDEIGFLATLEPNEKSKITPSAQVANLLYKYYRPKTTGGAVRVPAPVGMPKPNVQREDNKKIRSRSKPNKKDEGKIMLDYPITPPKTDGDMMKLKHVVDKLSQREIDSIKTTGRFTNGKYLNWRAV